MSEQHWLIWAAGGTATPTEPVDEEQALLLLQAHQLEIRARQRLRTERLGWMSLSLVRAVEDLAVQALAVARRQSAVLREVTAAAGGGDARPLQAKGLTYFLLTGAENAIRRWHDLDLFAPEPAALVSVLTGLGFRTVEKGDRVPRGRQVAHEYAKLVREGVFVDVHRHFPVWAYPADAAVGASTAGAGAAVVAADLTYHPLSLTALFAHAVERRADDGSAVLVANPEMTALVGCAHVFANCVTEFPAAYATVKLAEVANIYDLVRRPAFDWTAFDALVDAHRAQDAAAFALALVDRWFAPVGPGDRQPGRGHHPVLARSLWFARGRQGFIAAVGAVEQWEDMLVRTTPIGRLVGDLGGVPAALPYSYRLTEAAATATAATAAARGTAAGAAARAPGPEGGASPEVIRQGGGLAFGLRLAPRPDGLEMAVSAPGTAAAELNILLYTGEAAVEIVGYPTGEVGIYNRLLERPLPPGAGTVQRGTDGQGCPEYRCVLPWSTLPPGPGPDRVLPVLFGVRRWPSTGPGPDGSVLVPLQVVTHGA